jgi:hypothetical protein
MKTPNMALEEHENRMDPDAVGGGRIKNPSTQIVRGLALFVAVVGLTACRTTTPSPAESLVMLGTVCADAHGHVVKKHAPSHWYPDLIERAPMYADWILDKATTSEFNTSISRYLGLQGRGATTVHLTNVARVQLSDADFYHKVLPALRHAEPAVQTGYYAHAFWYCAGGQWEKTISAAGVVSIPKAPFNFGGNGIRVSKETVGPGIFAVEYRPINAALAKPGAGDKNMAASTLSMRTEWTVRVGGQKENVVNAHITNVCVVERTSVVGRPISCPPIKMIVLNCPGTLIEAPKNGTPDGGPWSATGHKADELTIDPFVRKISITLFVDLGDSGSFRDQRQRLVVLERDRNDEGRFRVFVGGQPSGILEAGEELAIDVPWDVWSNPSPDKEIVGFTLSVRMTFRLKS